MQSHKAKKCLYTCLKLYTSASRRCVERAERESCRATIANSFFELYNDVDIETILQELANEEPLQWSLLRHAHRLLGLSTKLVSIVPNQNASLALWITSHMPCRITRRLYRACLLGTPRSVQTLATQMSDFMTARKALETFVHLNTENLVSSKCLNHFWTQHETKQQTFDRVQAFVQSGQRTGQEALSMLDHSVFGKPKHNVSNKHRNDTNLARIATPCNSCPNKRNIITKVWQKCKKDSVAIMITLAFGFFVIVVFVYAVTLKQGKLEQSHSRP